MSKMIQDREKAIERRMDLTHVISYARKYKPSHFSPGEQICLHAERAALSRVIDHVDEKASYRLPQHLENKVKEVQDWMATNSKPI